MYQNPLSHLYSQETLSAQPSAIRDICALVARPEVRSLAGGWPDAAKFPLEEITRIFRQLVAQRGGEPFQYGSTEGLRDLRIGNLIKDRLAACKASNAA
jgi:2-aminoadipate transaminase